MVRVRVRARVRYRVRARVRTRARVRVRAGVRVDAVVHTLRMFQLFSVGYYAQRTIFLGFESF